MKQFWYPFIQCSKETPIRISDLGWLDGKLECQPFGAERITGRIVSDTKTKGDIFLTTW